MAYTRKQIADLIDGKLDWNTLHQMLSTPKDPERFDQYISILQERVPWSDPILLPYSMHLYIVQKENGDRVIKCDCGYEYGDYRENWKLNALIYVRDSEESLAELYPKMMCADPSWQVIREYYCPGCKTQLEVEAVTPWYPVIQDWVPDLEGFYEEWLGRPLPEPKNAASK